MNSPTEKVWYKQFWPWFLIFVPACSMVLSFTMIKLAVDTEDSLVIDDYYKEGKGINLQITKLQEAKAKNIQTQLFVNQSNIELEFISGLPKSGEALQLFFQHATLETKDFSVMLLKDANNVYRAQVDHPIDGKWKISLLPIDEQWKISQSISFPRSDKIPFNP